MQSADQEVETMAAAAGVSLSKVNTSTRGDEKIYRFFIRRGDTLLLNGESVSREELAELLQGGVKSET